MKPEPLRRSPRARAALASQRRRRRWFPAAAGAVALATAALTAKGRGQVMDHKMFRALNDVGGPAGDAFFKGITDLGSLGASTGAATTLWLAGRRREAADALGAACATWGLAQLLKATVLRPRPYQTLTGFRLRIGQPRSTTWPSAHPAVLIAFLTVASRNLEASAAQKGALLGLAGVVGISRIYLGVHYPADVAGGLLLGRGVADVWSGAVSPSILRRLPSVSVPIQ